MADHGRTRETTASPSRVWSIWPDPTTWSRWNPSVSRMDLDGPFADGTTGRMHTPQGRTHEVTFENIEEGKSYELATSVVPGTRFHFCCEIAANGTGSTLSQTVRMSGPLAFLLGPVMGPGMAKSFDKVLDGLKQEAETTGS